MNHARAFEIVSHCNGVVHDAAERLAAVATRGLTGDESALAALCGAIADLRTDVSRARTFARVMLDEEWDSISLQIVAHHRHARNVMVETLCTARTPNPDVELATRAHDVCKLLQDSLRQERRELLHLSRPEAYTAGAHANRANVRG